MDISDRIRSIYKKKGITQSVFAEKLGVSLSSVSKWLAGQPVGRENLKNIADTFNVDEKWLQYGDDLVEDTQEEYILKNSHEDLMRKIDQMADQIFLLTKHVKTLDDKIEKLEKLKTSKNENV
jgi:transcriptional regulator with XRE-family HTH domain